MEEHGLRFEESEPPAMSRRLILLLGASAMIKKRLDAYRKQLLDLVAKVQPDAQVMEEAARVATGGEAAGGLSNTPVHLGDIGSEVYRQELDATLFENERYLLSEVRAALRRIDGANFGLCEGCGRQISEERLTAIPYARHCRKCCQQIESGLRVNLNTGRPKRETDTIAAKEKLVEHPDLREGGPVAFTDFEGRTRPRADEQDIHAAGTTGGGSAIGGLAGTNVGRGDPVGSDLEMSMGSGYFDIREKDEDEIIAFSGRAGGAVGGTPAGKRVRPRNPRARRHE